MNAIDLLKSQHRTVEKLFSKIAGAKEDAKKQELFNQVADALAAHAAIEEHQFYPAVKAKRTEDILLESLQEHLGVKRVIADLLKTPAGDQTFDAKIKVLKEQVEHHVEEEESDLFPKVKKLLDVEYLEALGQEMSAEFEILQAGEPRKAVPSETKTAASI